MIRYISEDLLTDVRYEDLLTDVRYEDLLRDDSKTARSPMGGRGGHQKSKNWTQKDTGEKGVIYF